MQRNLSSEASSTSTESRLREAREIIAPSNTSPPDDLSPTMPKENTVMLSVIVDPDACIGSAECVALDPEAVKLDEHGTAQILLPELEEERAEQLCDACPTGALSIAGP
jgi:ferredoxin